MGNRNRIEAESQLPEVIIQHIQSFLNGKEAARTTILSKFWYSAWLTRPNLDFNESIFRDEEGFWKYANTIAQRYEKLNLKIENFRLCVIGKNNANFSAINELISKAMKLGAIYVDFKSIYAYSPFTLHHDVLGSENLERLSVDNCKIDLGEDSKVSCSRLKSLSLCNVYLEGDILWDIISRCPLIENLSLTGIKVSYGTQSSVLDLSPFVDFGKRNVGLVADGPISPYMFHNLKCLLLQSVSVHTSFFHDLSSKFPCLKDLVVCNCCGYKDIKICSRSLERISFTEYMMSSVKFDVPSIRKFTFSGNLIPLVSFVPAANNWESDISINCGYDPDAAWFVELNKLLTKLSQSKVSLFLTFLRRLDVDNSEKIQDLPRPVVENLTVSLPYPACPGLWNSLFRCCRPLFVTDVWHSKLGSQWGGFSYLKWVYESLTQQISLTLGGSNSRSRSRSSNRRKWVYESLTQQISLKQGRSSTSSSSQCDLKEVNVEYFDGDVSSWLLLPWKSVDNALERGKKFRFHLRWG